MRSVHVLFAILLSAQLSGQLNSVGFYAGYGADKVSNPYDFRMKPVFELGFLYNQPLTFNLSMVLNIGFNSQRIVGSGSSSIGYIPVDPNYNYLNADLFLRYWILNDILGFKSGKRSNCYVQADIATRPVNAYLTAGLLNELLVTGSDDQFNNTVVSGGIGAGVQFYMPISNHYQAMSPFFEILSTRNLTPRVTAQEQEHSFSRWMMRIGLMYSFSPGMKNPFY